MPTFISQIDELLLCCEESETESKCKIHRRNRMNLSTISGNLREIASQTHALMVIMSSGYRKLCLASEVSAFEVIRNQLPLS